MLQMEHSIKSIRLNCSLSVKGMSWHQSFENCTNWS